MQNVVDKRPDMFASSLVIRISPTDYFVGLLIVADVILEPSVAGERGTAVPYPRSVTG
jgi:hypothetical protein